MTKRTLFFLLIIVSSYSYSMDKPLSAMNNWDYSKPEVINRLLFSTQNGMLRDPKLVNFCFFNSTDLQKIAYRPFQEIFFSVKENSLYWNYLFQLSIDDPIRLLFEHAHETMENRVLNLNNLSKYKAFKASLANENNFKKLLAQTNKQWPGDLAYSPFLVAVSAGSFKATRLFLKKAKEIQYKFNDDALLMCVKSLFEQLLTFQRVRYTNPDSINAQTVTRTLDGYYKIANTLLKYGIAHVKNKDGITPLYAASACGFSDLVRLFLYHRKDQVANDNGRPYPKGEDITYLYSIEERFKELKKAMYATDASVWLPVADHDKREILFKDFENCNWLLNTDSSSYCQRMNGRELAAREPAFAYPPHPLDYFDRLPQDLKNELKKYILKPPHVSH